MGKTIVLLSIVLIALVAVVVYQKVERLNDYDKGDGDFTCGFHLETDMDIGDIPSFLMGYFKGHKKATARYTDKDCEDCYDLRVELKDANGNEWVKEFRYLEDYQGDQCWKENGVRMCYICVN